MARVTYNPKVFETPNVEAAKRIIVTATPTQTTDQRWEIETPYLADLIGDALALQPDHLVIDYGCGLGRVAKALIDKYKCRVLGVDISPTMRAQAPTYVNSEAFSVVSRSVLFSLSQRGLRADAAIAIWVLQHCGAPKQDIDLIKSAVAHKAPIAVVNSVYRAVPALEVPWAQDDQDVKALLDESLAFDRELALDPKIGEDVAQKSWCRFYRR